MRASHILNAVLIVLLLSGLAFAAGQAYGPGSAGQETTRTVEAQPSVVTTVPVDPNQNEAAADIVANEFRASLCCQHVGTTPARIRIGAATAGVTGVIVAGGAAANDGTGGSFCTNQTGAIYIYDVSNAGNADMMCVEESWQ